jgi:hypothetical protein
MYEAPEIARTEGGFIDDYCDIAIFQRAVIATS